MTEACDDLSGSNHFDYIATTIELDYAARKVLETLWTDMTMLLSAANAVTRQAQISKDASLPCDLRISLRKDGPDGSNSFLYHPGDVLPGHLTFFHGVAVTILQVVVTLEGEYYQLTAIL